MKKFSIYLVATLLCTSLSAIVWGSETIKMTSSSVASQEPELPALNELPSATLSSSPKVYVRKIQIEGNTVIQEKKLAHLTQAYEHREIYHQELEQLRQKLSKLYLDTGYINSGVIIPDQKIQNGNITLQVVEGRLTRIEVSGVDKLNPGFVEERLASTEDDILHLSNLEEKLQLLKRDIRIDSIATRLMPSERRGEATLFVNIREQTPYKVMLEANNHRSPSIGALRGEISAEHQNVSGWGDEARIRFGLTEGLNDYSLSYSYPWRKGRHETGVAFDRSDANIVEAPFDDIDIESQTTNVSLQYRYWQIKRLQQSMMFAFHLDRKESKTYLANKPFSFSPGVDEGVSRVAVFRIIGEITKSSKSFYSAIRSSFNFGIDALNATENTDLPDGKFVSWLGQLRLSQKVFTHQLSFHADVQIASEALLPLEKFSIGGHSSVRGYRENLLSHDSGWVVSLEYRVPIKLKFLKRSRGNLLAFYDHGRGYDKSGGNHDLDAINSAGIGMQWSPMKQLYAELFGAYALKNVSDNLDDIQDKGIHFKLRYQVY